jgi:HAD superfamily hydrolase (TIGR01509 family)
MSALSRALLLDLDGTLADSIPGLRRAYSSFLRGFSLEGSEREFQSLNGPPIPQIVEFLKERHRLPGDSADLLARYEDLLVETHRGAVPAGGGTALLARASAARWKVAVVTSSRRESATAWLSRHGLPVDLVVGGDDVARGKPAPDPYLLALDRLSAAAAMSLAVEDSRAGAAAAVAAGVPTVAIARLDDQGGWPTVIRFVESLAGVVPFL